MLTIKVYGIMNRAGSLKLGNVIVVVQLIFPLIGL